MADKSATTTVQTETYEGPGKIGTALDTGVSWMSVVYGVAVVALAKGKSISQTALHVAAGVVGVVAGAFGYLRAAKGESQFETMKGKLTDSDARASALQAQVNGLTQEVATYRKSFAQGVPSRAEHGSHAGASQADKAAAAEAAINL